MREQRPRPERGDVQGPARGDFTDWNNPEDEEWEDAPEGYYDEDDESYLPDEDDPDYDLSEAAGYAGWDSPKRESVFPQWLIVAVSLLLVLAILTPLLIRLS